MARDASCQLRSARTLAMAHLQPRIHHTLRCNSRHNFQCYTRSLIKIMSSPFIAWPNFTLANVLHIAVILAIALILNRLLRVLTKLLIRPATSLSRVAQSREQQTRTVAGVLYSAGSKIVWAVAILTVVPEFGINVTPVAALAGLASLALG